MISKEVVDWSKFELYHPEAEEPRLRISPSLSLARRCPKEIRLAKSLRIERSERCSRADHSHCMVIVNGHELCPISAILFLVSARNYKWTRQLKSAINRIATEAFI